MASRNSTQYYSQCPSNYELQLPAEAYINLNNIVFSPEIESNFQKASKKISKGQEGSKKVMRKKHNRARNPWTPQEDAKLVELMKKHGQSWAMISASMEGRTGKQIRDRFLNKLRPNIKCGDWSVEEDELMIRLLNEIGNRWSLIATHLPGRTEGQVKNRYYSSIKKRLESSGVVLQSSASVSEVVSSFPTSPETEEPKFDFGFDFDASVLTELNQVAIPKNNTMISKGPYAFEEDTNSDETTTQGYASQSESPCRATNPVSVLSYDFSNNFMFSQPSETFFVPTIENDNQIDDVLGNVANYFLDNSSTSSDVDAYFSDDLKSQKQNSQSSDLEADKLALLSRRKAFLELALAKTLKEIKSL